MIDNVKNDKINKAGDNYESKKAGDNYLSQIKSFAKETWIEKERSKSFEIKSTNNVASEQNK